MIKVEAILPDPDKLKKDIWETTNRQAREIYEKQVTQILRDVQCPVHHQHPRVRLDAVDLSRNPRELSYKVQSPCCQKLVEEVEKKIGAKIQIADE